MESLQTTPASPLSRALETIRRLKAQLDARQGRHALAVVGVGLRFPGAIDSLDRYWAALAERRDLVRAMPQARKGPFAAQWDSLPHKGGFLDDVTGFDAALFGISPREARALDPQHRLLLEVGWEALENAALPPDRLKGSRTGVYVGVTGTGHDYCDWRTGAPDALWATGNGHCFSAGRLAYTLGLNGPALAIDTACSSGLVAVHLASQAVRSGECDVAIAGGVSLILSPRSTQLVKQTRALSPDGVCRTFDARASGFTRGEGCGIVVLKRLDDALRDGDHVHAVIHGSAVNQDGRSSGFAAPNVSAQIALIEAALADAALAPADIGLIEAHGTATALGDPIEMRALVEALGKKNAGARLYVGSVKTNFGHLEAAAGVAGLIKAIACCAHRAIPALVHYETLNPRIDLEATGITLPTALVPWNTEAAGRFAGVSSFGISGTNAHMIVGAAAPREATTAEPVSGFELSARTPEALRVLAARFRDRLADVPDGDYAAFAYTASFGRAQHSVRARVAAANPTAAKAALDAIARNTPCAAVTLGACDAPLPHLLRRVLALPHYPWEREPYVPESLNADARWDALWSRPPINERGLGDIAAPPSSPPTSSAPGALLRLPESTAVGAMRGHVRRHVAAVLGHRDASAVCDDVDFSDLGLDSLMALDLAHALSLAFAIELPVALVFDHSTVSRLAAAVAGQLATVAPCVVELRPSPPTRCAPRIALLFSCQGSQYPGMGRELYATEPVFRARIDDCDRILAPQLGASLVDLMMRSDDREAIHQTRVTQPALVALELAIAELWRSWGVTASVVTGHSVGEVAAAIHAGAMDLESGLTLIAHRARLMQSTASGAMMSVAAPLANVVEWLEGTEVDIAAINGPASIVVAGAQAAVAQLAARLRAEGVTARQLIVSHASHSRMMDPILDALHDSIAGLAFHPPSLPVVSNLTGRLAADDDYDASFWCRHVRGAVRFHDGAQALSALDIDVCLEVGPDATLVSLMSAAGLLPAGGGVASLRRGASDRATIRDAIEKLRAQGQRVACGEIHAAAPRRRALRDAIRSFVADALGDDHPSDVAMTRAS